MLCGGGETRRRFAKQGRDFLECRGCGLVWIDPMPTPEDRRQRYAASYREGNYKTFAAADEIRRLIATHRLDELLPLARAGRWLDVGCATGSFVALARDAGNQAEGIDISPEAVARARERGITAHCVPVDDFEPERRYETVTAFDLIEHLLEPRAFVARLRDWIVPGGTLALALPDLRSIYPRVLMRRHWFYYWPDDHLFYFGADTIARLLREEGFAVEEIRRAYKPLTLRYTATALEMFNPVLGRLARAATRALPRGFAERPWKLYLGEMLVVARRAEPASETRAAGR
jgi:2-polyprenyl-3-methyl-5-hydroxy-6-metoxy-1,4-benzoquinol methylase